MPQRFSIPPIIITTMAYKSRLNPDIDVGYIFADQLSFYLMFYYVHVTASNLINDVENYLDKNNNL